VNKPPTAINLKHAQREAVAAARAVGAVMRRHLARSKRALAVTQHDIKLALDVRCQKLIEKSLLAAFPQAALLGEEGDARDVHSEYRWVVDPIDGTVNFAYGIPHASVSIALQQRTSRPTAASYEDAYETLTGVVYDPFADELWTAIRGEPARLNGRPVHVSRRRKLSDGIVSIGFAKTRENLDATLPYFLKLVHQVRKIRIMGSAALALTYVATGRFDAYIERGIRLWDIAAGGLIVECAGGRFWRQAVSEDHTYRMIASNGILRPRLRLPD
jgi:myo-inositol-1(or 4)-monophosphatase